MSASKTWRVFIAASINARETLSAASADAGQTGSFVGCIHYSWTPLTCVKRHPMTWSTQAVSASRTWRVLIAVSFNAR